MYNRCAWAVYTGRVQPVYMGRVWPRVLGTHYPCSWPVKTASIHGWSKDALYTREYGHCTRAVLTGAWYTLAVFMGRERGPCLRAVFTALITI